MEILTFIVIWYLLGLIGSAIILYTALYRKLGRIVVSDLMVGAAIATMDPLNLLTSIILAVGAWIHENIDGNKVVWQKKNK